MWPCHHSHSACKQIVLQQGKPANRATSKTCVIGFVANLAFNGTARENQFYFASRGLNYLSVNMGAQQFPSQALTRNYQAGECVKAFNQLCHAIGITNSREGLDVSLVIFKNGHLYAFDLTADIAEDTHVDPITHGSLRIEAHFSATLTHPLSVIVYAEYDNLIHIDKVRNIITDFGPS